jgi:murein DD-endopeptidase MepM/ murein hydrolase activator NlpD
MHPGIDIGAPQGATIAASAGGRVIFAGWYGGYGNAIIIDHGGSMSTLYGHCSQIFVSEGQDVQRGQAIGAVGMTGRATGPHLHFEVRVNGVPVDPTSRLH